MNLIEITFEPRDMIAVTCRKGSKLPFPSVYMLAVGKILNLPGEPEFKIAMEPDSPSYPPMMTVTSFGGIAHMTLQTENTLDELLTIGAFFIRPLGGDFERD